MDLMWLAYKSLRKTKRRIRRFLRLIAAERNFKRQLMLFEKMRHCGMAVVADEDDAPVYS